MFQELSITDVLRDPLIRLVMVADKVAPGDLEELLQDAAKASHRKSIGCLNQRHRFAHYREARQ